MRGIALIALVAACSFRSGALPDNTDAAPDGPPPITIGFANVANSTDEEAGTAQVRVILSQAATEAITVSFAVTGGSASRPSDFLLNDGTLTFAPGDVEETIDITIGPDGEAEPDETIILTLTNPSGGAMLAIDVHTLTIGMNTLPRVTFSNMMSNAQETVAASGVNVVLDKPSQLTTSVELTVMSGTATGGGTDYTIQSTTITFNPGETSIPVPLAVVNDAMDEDNETVTLELATPTNIVVGTTSTTTHTIEDEDAAPTVSFAATGQRQNEGSGTVMIAVSLSAVSGKSVDVPFSISGSSTATGGGVDYSVNTTSPLAFPAGTMSVNIAIPLVDDTAIEGTETVIINLGTPNPSTNATLGTQPTYTLQIGDNDSTCLGPDATPFSLCFATPSNTVTINAALNTDTSPLCSATPPIAGWTGQPSSCFVVAQTINVSGASVVTGTRPLVLFASGNITVSASIDAASHRGGTTGPAANTGCGAYTDAPAASSTGGGGGAGGTFRTVGGDGGQGNGAGGSGGTAVAVGSTPTTLRGGCAGQKGADGSTANGHTGGAGGGAVYVVAGGTLTVNTGITINVSGAGADALTGAYAGGGGGGSGGMLVMIANTYSTSGAQFMANGGGGSRGGDSNDAGADGFDPVTTSATAGGAGGTSGTGGGVGGRGFGTTTATEAGANGGAGNAGGGGGGGGGYIRSSAALTGATVSAGEIVAQ